MWCWARRSIDPRSPQRRGDEPARLRCRVRVIATILPLFAVTACNPFKTGTPETPTGSEVDYPPPTTTDNVLTIIGLALGAQDNRAYLERLAADFVFRPDPVQLPTTEFRNFPANWSRDHEEVFLAALFSNVDSVAVEWRDVLTQPQGTGADVTARYSLTAFRTGQPETRYSGEAHLSMEQVAGVWNIRRWDDLVVSGASETWGLLRARFIATG